MEYRPATPAARRSPLVVHYHGGAYIFDDLNTAAVFCRTIVRDHDAVVIDVDYRLAPEHPFSAGKKDAWDALEWVAKNYSALEARPSLAFLVVGCSAGGNIAASMALEARDRSLQPSLTGAHLNVPETISSEQKLPDKYARLWLSRDQNKDAPILNQSLINFMTECYKPDLNSHYFAPAHHPHGHSGLPKTYIDGYGHTVIPDVLATADTLWYACSTTTKAQVAALLSQLIHSNNYTDAFSRGWETPISSIICDDFVLQDEWATAHVTLNDSVSHRTGLGRHNWGLLRVRDGEQLLPWDVTRNLRNLAMIKEPRVQWSYCNYVYVALGHVLETVTGQWLGRALREHLWTPLGMDSTYFDVEVALVAPHRYLAADRYNSRDEVWTREKAVEILFPNRPEPPLPSSFGMHQLVGTYTNAGWGEVAFTEAQHGSGTGGSVLVGPRPHASFRHTFVLEHMTGNYWLLTAVTDGGSPFTKRFFAARFVAGVDREPIRLELDTAQGPSNAGDGVIVFGESK
ncbi:Beta-lactamase-type transpeptidase fold domain containing protein [Cordyceps fumosorosea ARSEF 2679]|uniref:Beta-lactamase-type transpeptidase fold domain containing protein n=1 Tax=Cordyceps fumosorosea (strain ARSEF 2679) TaxID=1081104 RepID=A0A162MA16_CORFA|nr:Beta-lactamase-type transpeptidase fold domain containing protein [Cordyceps fumosorosea ARSEF 2679]OAA53170.1 Beta-lactamase-type transpeptidase fold domain containing protein [Cordyceps fumosorosea ARSEF 2679]